MMKKTLAVVLAMMLALSMFAGAAFAANTVGDPNKEYVIGICMAAAGDHQREIAAALTARIDETDNLSYEFVDHQTDVANEFRQLEDYIAKKVDLIVCTPCDAEALVDVIKQANEAGIPVIETDMKTNGGEYTFVGANDADSAALQAEVLAKVLPENATCCILLGTLGHSGQLLRSEGIKKLFELRPDVKVLSEETGAWKVENGMTITENWLQMYPDLNCIISQNDNMALGAIEAITAAGKAGEIFVVGVDAIAGACEAIKNGSMLMSAFNDGPGKGEMCYEVACKILNGEEVDAEYILPYKSVSIENVEEYIK